MGFMGFCQWLGDTDFSKHLREAPYDFPILIIIHILTIAFCGGMVVMGNLRVLGLAMRSVPVSELIGQFRPWKWAAFASLLVSGTLLAMSDPVEYGGNIMFWISNVLLLLAGFNAFIFRWGAYRRVKEWDSAPQAPPSARRWATFSLFLWIILIFAGRAIAFF
jgi:uncharacterized membrane protein